jgi:hypothetical protein
MENAAEKLANQFKNAIQLDNLNKSELELLENILKDFK